tara:strand:+ start:887 stop:1654 length:768 start_codon:yes stop_codon:yes gene_type:complete
MKAIILAAGEGSRLRPYTIDCPKCLVEVNGSTILDQQINILKSEGINDIQVVGGFKADKLREKEYNLIINKDYAETNMVHTLFCAEKELNTDILVSYGDIVYSRDILKTLLQSNFDIAVSIDMNWRNYWESRTDNPLDDVETLRLSKVGKILEIGRKPKSLDEVEGQYMGLMKFSKKGVSTLKKFYQRCKKTSGFLAGKPIHNAYMTDLLQEMIDQKITINAIPVKGDWIEIDTVDDLKSDITQNRLKRISKKMK